MISPHARGSLDVGLALAGFYLAIGFIAGVVVGAVAASVVWFVVG